MATLTTTPELRAFLDLIAHSEGTATHPLTKCDGYDVIVTSIDGRHVFTDFSTHPFALGRPPVQINQATPPLFSTASGRYQLILPTWRTIAPTLHLGTFSPANQDLAALKLLEECKAVDPISAGGVALAIQRASLTWASFPGNLYGQHPHSLENLLAMYATLLTADKII